MNILFIDRDGTLIEEPQDYQVDALNKVKLMRGVIPALLKLQEAGYRLVMVSNQDGLGTKSFPQVQFSECQDFLITLLQSQGIEFDQIFICPHFANQNCSCRKPQIGLVVEYIKKNAINNRDSWVLGDRTTDQQFAQNLGLNFCRISPETPWSDCLKRILKKTRKANILRETQETKIALTIDLEDSETKTSINTPLPFFNHMLEQVAKHSGFSLQLSAAGDTDVDDHHLIEDVAIILGTAIKQALGDKQGIERYGFLLPMDEALVSIALDLSGRSFSKFSGQFTREQVGGIATEMIPHFFYSFAHALEATLHITIEGKNNHHMIEACFKALGRVLKQACACTGIKIPSTKGVL
ncbi:MAG: bifunctional imidazole glycerol-phosphate dehydratase/histidinol phosphatase [Legionella sp. 40-6]|nr:bifunctional histidinol-phosphatase/imidazoleglycerol-phosphate dehydratase HisB [Legionella sp.]OJY46419.1 MAG: bifunctional imidazole glycerol-phosphate dehydratase/histidinol phosphatase [Legionella sp. 40-6]